jgi:hypothetical protein
VNHDIKRDEQRRPPRPLRKAEVRPGLRGDFGVTAWFQSQAEAEAIAAMVNQRLREIGSAQ